RATADADALDRFRAAMDDDLDTPRAMAELAGLVRAANTALDAGDAVVAAPQAAAVDEQTRAVGLQLSDGREDAVPAEVAALVAERDQARAARDFASSDALRDRLDALGWRVEDTPQGTRVHRKDT
ncbi:MAG TPA: DALR domain-containing protein, partial [Acidimicrobiales bacterium]|nr:DALR domain-containing protein [Acidimicrobiales bacterium]